MTDEIRFDLDAMHTEVIAHQTRTLESVSAGRREPQPLIPYRVVGWEARGQAFGASELGVLLGVSPYEDRASLIRRKATGERIHSKPAMKLGSCLESGILAFYREMTGREAKAWPPRQTIACDAFPHLVVTPDATEDGGPLLEIKHSAGGKGWGVGSVIDDAEGFTTHAGSAAPLHYQVQVQGQMAVTGHAHCRIVGLIRGRLRVYEVPRHEGVIARIRQECIDGWNEVQQLRKELAREEK